MKVAANILVVLAAGFLIWGCDELVDGDTDPDPDPDEEVYTLSVEIEPSEAGSADPQQEDFEAGETVTVEAIADEGWQFLEWTGDIESQDNPLEFTIEEDTELTAHFQQSEYSLTAHADPEEGGSLDPESGTFTHGETVTVEAQPEDSWGFVEWTGDIESQDNPLEFTIEEDTDITAHFESLQDYELTIESDPEEGGSVDPGSGHFEEGTQIEAEATANQGWTFSDWSGDIVSSENPLTFTINSDMHLTAHFEDIRSEYLVDLVLSDPVGRVDELEFGQSEDPFTEDAPPSPPGDALHAYFETNNEELFKDIRSHMQTEVSWQLHYQAGEEDNLTLSWTIDPVKMEGELILKDVDGDLEINMRDQDSFEFEDGDYESFEIHYEVEL